MLIQPENGLFEYERMAELAIVDFQIFFVYILHHCK